MLAEIEIAPECPVCGCNDTRVLEGPREVTMGREVLPVKGLAQCCYCEHKYRFSASADNPPDSRDAVPYVCVRCPRCRSKEVRATSSPVAHNGSPRVRWHKCWECGKNFKSVEAVERSRT